MNVRTTQPRWYRSRQQQTQKTNVRRSKWAEKEYKMTNRGKIYNIYVAASLVICWANNFSTASSTAAPKAQQCTNLPFLKCSLFTVFFILSCYLILLQKITFYKKNCCYFFALKETFLYCLKPRCSQSPLHTKTGHKWPRFSIYQIWTTNKLLISFATSLN